MGKKMDRKLASKQKFEIAYIAKKFGASQKVVREVQKQVGRSRRKVYARLKKLGYNLKK